jgi:hypothetical protein
MAGDSILVRSIVAGMICGTTLAGPALAQQRPLVTEDPETIGAGRILLEGGFDYYWDVEYPVSGLTGDLLSVPTLGVSVGLSSIAELQIDGGLYQKLDISSRVDAPLSHLLDFEGDSTTSIPDLFVATKVRFLSEGESRPAMGLRLATKLPTASSETGLGLDKTDFFATLQIGKTIRSSRVVGNVGVGILGDPTNGSRQNDVLLYGLSFARAVTPRAEFVAEVNGQADMRDGEPLPGTESHMLLRLGARFTQGPVRIDAAAVVGLLSVDPAFGITTGFTYVFNAFRVP